MKRSHLVWRTITASLSVVILAAVYSGAILGCGGGSNPADNFPPVSNPSLNKAGIYYLGDHLGNAHIMSDSSGNALREENKYPYGLNRDIESAYAVPSDYTYTEKEYDEETGLIYFGGRYYSPEMGRWISPDPMVLENTSAAIKRPLEGNLYAYVRNNPVCFIDPNGLQSVEISRGYYDEALGQSIDTSGLLQSIAVRRTVDIDGLPAYSGPYFSSLHDADPRGILRSRGINPELGARVDRVIENAHRNGMDILLTGGYRGIAYQNRLYMQGRTAPGTIVTNARGGSSFHNFGLAVDFAFNDPDGQLWSEEHQWSAVGDLGKEMGLQWGGDWRGFSDKPHLQYNPTDKTPAELLQIYNQGGLEDVWNAVQNGE